MADVKFKNFTANGLMELKFYYPYIRQNMADRVAAFLGKKE